MGAGGRIQQLLDERDISQAELARRVKLRHSTINGLIRGQAQGSKHLHKIARELGTSAAYLAGETDDPGEGALPAPRADEIAEQLDAVMIPEVQVGLSMGGGAAIEDWPVVQQVPFSRAWLRSLTPNGPEHLMVARGEGDSMMPTLLDRDLAIIDRA